MPDVLPRIAEWGNEWGKRDPNTDHWHFGPIGVPPELQKTGVGRLMMQHFCKRVDETGAMAYLETDRPENVGFYEKSGFAVIEEGIVLDTPNWFMSRPGIETS